MFLVSIAAANATFAATDTVNQNQTSGYINEYNYKGIASNQKIQTFFADDSPVNGVYQANDKKYYTFTTKKKNYLIKSISVKFEYYDKASSSYKNLTKVYKFKNKKSVIIQLPRYQQTVYAPGGHSVTIYSKGVPSFSYYTDVRTYSYPYSVIKFTIKYSNNKKEDSSKFASATSQYQQRKFTGKKTTITRLYKVSLSTSNIVGNIKYTIQAKKKTAKIKKVSMKLGYYDSTSQKYMYKTIQINGKKKNAVVKNVSKKYDFVSAKVTY